MYCIYPCLFLSCSLFLSRERSALDLSRSDAATPLRQVYIDGSHRSSDVLLYPPPHPL